MEECNAYVPSTMTRRARDKRSVAEDKGISLEVCPAYIPSSSVAGDIESGSYDTMTYI